MTDTFGTGGAHRLTSDGTINESIPVRAVNRSDVTVTWLYAREKYVLEPGVPQYVPYMAMVYWQGDPRAVDLPGGKLHEQFRRQQREHLRSVYGVYENDDKWGLIPLVECYPIDSDIRFETVLLDPDGTSLSEVKSTTNETEFLRKQLLAMQEQMRVLQSQLLINEQTNAAVVAAGLDPNDLDHQATLVKTIGPELPTDPVRKQAPGTMGRVVRQKSLTNDGAGVTKDA